MRGTRIDTVAITSLPCRTTVGADAAVAPSSASRRTAAFLPAISEEPNRDATAAPSLAAALAICASCMKTVACSASHKKVSTTGTTSTA